MYIAKVKNYAASFFVVDYYQYSNTRNIWNLAFMAYIVYVIYIICHDIYLYNINIFVRTYGRQQLGIFFCILSIHLPYLQSTLKQT